MRRKHAPRKAHFNTSLLCWSTFCLSGCCPSQSEGSLLRTSRCRPGFLRLTGGPRPPRLHPRLDGRPLSRCAAPRQSDRCRPGLSASWRPIGSLSVQTGYRCRCVDCAARLHCRHQTAPIGRKERGVCSALLKWHNEVNIFKGIKHAWPFTAPIHTLAHTLFILGFPPSWPSSSSSSSRSLSLPLPLPLPEALLADRGLSCSESDPEPEPDSETQQSGRFVLWPKVQFIGWMLSLPSETYEALMLFFITNHSA